MAEDPNFAGAPLLWHEAIAEQPEQHAQSLARGMRLGPALLLLDDADTHIPEPWRAQFVKQFADSDILKLLSQTCTRGWRWILQESKKAACTIGLDVAAPQLHKTLSHARQALHRGPRPGSVHLKQQEGDNSYPAYLAVSMLAQCAANVTDLILTLPSCDPAFLAVALTSFPHITTLGLSTDLTDDVLPVLLQHAPQLRHVTVGMVNLTTQLAATTTTCPWATLTITATPVEASTLGYLPLAPAGTPLTVTLPAGASSLLCETAGAQGLAATLLQRLSRMVFTGLSQVVLTRGEDDDSDDDDDDAQAQEEGGEGDHAMSLLLALQQLTALHLPYSQLRLNNWDLTPAVWRSLADAAGAWQRVVFKARQWDDGLLDSDVLNLVYLGVRGTLTTPLLGSLLQHAPGLEELVVREMDLDTVGQHAQAVWVLKRLSVKGLAVLPAAQLTLLPQQAPGVQLCLDTQSELFTVRDVTQEGLPDALQARLSQWWLGDVKHVSLSLAASTQGAGQVQGLQAALAQLQAAGLSKACALTLNGWTMSAKLANYLGANRSQWRSLQLEELTWPPGLHLATQLPGLLCVQLLSPVEDGLLGELLWCLPDTGKVVFCGGLTLASDKFLRTQEAGWSAIEVRSPEVDLLTLARLPLRPRGRTWGKTQVDVVESQITFSLASEWQEDEVQLAMQAATFSLFRVTVVLRAPDDVDDDEQMDVLGYNTRALSALAPGSTSLVAHPRMHSVTLSRWRMRPAMVTLLPDLATSQCALIFADDIEWPDDPDVWLHDDMPYRVPTVYVPWQFPDSCSTDWVVTMCAAALPVLRAQRFAGKLCVRVSSEARAQEVKGRLADEQGSNQIRVGYPKTGSTADHATTYL